MINKSAIFLCTILFFQISPAQPRFVNAKGNRFYLNNLPPEKCGSNVINSFSKEADQIAMADDLPADKKATREMINLYHNLKKLVAKGIMFGHQDDLAYGVGWKYEPGKSDVKDVTGDYPAVYGFELGRIELDQPVNIDSVPFDKMKIFIQTVYERGGVVTLSWHLNNPLTGKTAWDPAPGTVASILPGGQKMNYIKAGWIKLPLLF